MKFVAGFPQAPAHAHAHKYVAGVLCFTANQLLGGYKVVVIVTTNSLFVRLSCGWHTQYEVVKNLLFSFIFNIFMYDFKVEAHIGQTKNLPDSKSEYPNYCRNISG